MDLPQLVPAQKASEPRVGVREKGHFTGRLGDFSLFLGMCSQLEAPSGCCSVNFSFTYAEL